MDLKNLFVDVEGLDLRAMEEKGRFLYKEIYLQFGVYGIVKAHDGEDVFFWGKRFEHAFFTSRNRARHPDDKSNFAVDRMTRIRWIGPIIAGQVEGVACYKAQGPGQTKPFTNRLYVVSSELYVVWLEPRKEGGWRFSSAYPASAQDIRQYCKNAKRIWKYQEKPRD